MGTVSTPDVIAVAIRLHYDEAPLDDYDRALLVDLLIDALPDGHPDVELARSGVWSGTLEEWLKIGPGIVRRVPLVSVGLTDRKPYWLPNAKRFAWYACENPLDEDRLYKGTEDLPSEWWPESNLYDCSKRYETEELALADASRRAIS